MLQVVGNRPAGSLEEDSPAEHTLGSQVAAGTLVEESLAPGSQGIPEAGIQETRDNQVADTRERHATSRWESRLEAAPQQQHWLWHPGSEPAAQMTGSGCSEGHPC